MNGQDIQIEQNKAYESMEKSNKKAHEKDLEMAEHIRQYDIALGQKILQLRSEGMPLPSGIEDIRLTGSNKEERTRLIST